MTQKDMNKIDGRVKVLVATMFVDFWAQFVQYTNGRMTYIKFYEKHSWFLLFGPELTTRKQPMSRKKLNIYFQSELSWILT